MFKITLLVIQSMMENSMETNLIKSNFLFFCFLESMKKNAIS